MKRKYSSEDLAKYQQLYQRTRGGDLTSYAAMLGDSFALKIDSLAQLLQDAHLSSVGIYKEKLLRRAISDFVPKRYEVATGFVLFPKSQLSSVGDDIQQRQERSSLHEISRQLDIIVFDSYSYPVIFRDDDFVVVRPESVRSIVEVKGALDQQSTDETVDLFIDYARKWKACRSFYKSWYPKMKPPGMYLMAWAPAVDQKGYPKTDGTRLRKRIVEHYKSQVSKEELPGFPLLQTAYIYGDCMVLEVYWMGKDSDFRFGYSTTRGRLIRYREDGNIEIAGDKTIAALLAAIHYSLDTPFNPSLAYVDQTNRVDALPHEHEGFECWLEGKETELVAPKNFED